MTPGPSTEEAKRQPPIAIRLPRQFVLDGKIAENVVRQLRRDEVPLSTAATSYSRDGIRGQLLTWGQNTSTLIVPRTVEVPPGINEVLRTPNGAIPIDGLSPDTSRARTFWVSPAPRDLIDIEDDEWDQLASSIRDSWQGRFFFRQERRHDGTTGLRPPQIGALHATLAHWTVSEEAATIVMPTGTGKTETMLALLASQRLERLLVVVPTSPLREQIATKFLTFGLLRKLGVLSEGATYPVVGVLEHVPSSSRSAEAFLRCCNVVVATMQVVNGCPEEIRRVLVDQCSHLFVDEAHHIPADTWSDFHRRFSSKPIVQFTATPYRNDGKLVGGQVIFDYPLQKVQEDGYFKPITLRSVWALNSADEVIANAALTQLATDLDNGRDHIVMARTSDIKRATAVHEIYQRLAPEHNPLLIHSRLRPTARNHAIQQLRARDSRVAVCVNMLGEGFDLPQLKIAAMHDVHRSLPITLQFIGRFTRTHDESIGDATAIANLADVHVEESVRTLFAEDSDWNAVIRRLGTDATRRHVERIEFAATFTDLPTEVPFQNLLPKMSTAVFRTAADRWTPDALTSVVPERMLLARPSVSHEHNVAWFVTREAEPIPWGRAKELENVIWHLYVLYWDRERQLLFINSSNKASLHEDLAEAVIETATLIKGEQVYRAMAGIKRLIPSNLGLRHVISKNVSHTSLFGLDVANGLDLVRTQNKTKSYLFGRGYEAGSRATIGCSAKGRIWANAVAGDISEWVAWCRHIGAKLLDEEVVLDDIFRNFVIPIPVVERPPLVPLAIEWPAEFLERSEEAIDVKVGEEIAPFYEVGLEVTEHNREGPIKFRVTTLQAAADYELTFTQPRPTYAPTGDEAIIVIGSKEVPLSQCFRQTPPKIRFERDTYIENDQLLQVPVGTRERFPRDGIVVWDWNGVDIRKESQKDTKRADSIQRRVIERLLEQDYDVVFDDDDSGEAADVVALRTNGDLFVAHLYHCKFSGEAKPGGRVADLYPVCGQAQKSIRWREDLEHFLEHLKLREAKREEAGRPSRFERGDYRTLQDIRRRWSLLGIEFKVFIVQPGLSQASASAEQLDLLAATKLLLDETFVIDFEVIGSA